MTKLDYSSRENMFKILIIEMDYHDNKAVVLYKGKYYKLTFEEFETLSRMVNNVDTPESSFNTFFKE